MLEQFWMYSVSQKKVAPPPPKKIFSLKFCQFVASIYPHMSTNFGLFILIFNKMALIFPGVLIIFTVSSFEFQQVRLPWLNRYDEWPNSPNLNSLYYQV